VPTQLVPRDPNLLVSGLPPTVGLQGRSRRRACARA
jgi:hypothetical protein